MFISSNVSEGIPSRLYRSVDEIRREMLDIRKKITDTGEMLSVHALFTDMIAERAREYPEKYLEELEEAVETTRGALRELEELNETLDELRSELENTRWALGL